ncbi:NAD+ synthase [Desulfocurvibacter africanus]|uniref:Glutamine-dependent NAD(+) synthetase n=1 Tax=Desulfocurvibacter africanus subsp. africanus str. Walvis Bay TaxID=690850 RepID=F3Z073_DESAF|nr:NAD+ synthase [Desulfocurvibacter africanus]EGJ49775.1 NAD+ synthetase [Desulfocurvibacter africanus subsp. africanus str. Walvis Bay]
MVLAMRLGLIQLNPTVGDIEGNAARIEQAVRRATAQGARLCLTSEMALTGYPPRDLLLFGSFVRRVTEALEDLARRLANEAPVLVGTVEANPGPCGKLLRNAAVLLGGGRVRHSFHKTLLPTYDVFDESRYFEPSQEPKLFELDGLRMAVTVCEDIWNDKDYWPRRNYAFDPLEALASQAPDVILNLSASPFHLGKQAERERMLAAISRKYKAPLAYVNQVGGNDDLIFDGRSTVFDSQGRILARLAAFAEDVAVVNLAASPVPLPADLSGPADALEALVMGTRDYARKCGFKSALLGLSGGIDSALTAAVAARALGPDNVLGVLMPSPYSSRGSIDDSLELARNLGLRTLTLPIAPLMAAFEQTLEEPFRGLCPDVTEENIQSRIRGNLLMALSNKYCSMLLTTGNKSELAVGYCTIYGDMSGGLAVISDAPKTLVYAMSRQLNADSPTPIIPESILTKPPSAELRPGQVDQDSLPPYDVLDAILALHIEEHRGLEEIVAAGFDEPTVHRVLKLVAIAEFKRRQAAPGLRITRRAFGTGWRMPIARRWTF